MKVLHVVSSIATKYGGPSEAAIGMVKHQKMQGVNAKIAIIHFINEKPRKDEFDIIWPGYYLFKTYLSDLEKTFNRCLCNCMSTSLWMKRNEYSI